MSDSQLGSMIESIGEKMSLPLVHGLARALAMEVFASCADTDYPCQIVADENEREEIRRCGRLHWMANQIRRR